MKKTARSAILSFYRLKFLRLQGASEVPGIGQGTAAGEKRAVHLFKEFAGLKVLQTGFFANDDQVAHKKKLKPEPSGNREHSEEIRFGRVSANREEKTPGLLSLFNSSTRAHHWKWGGGERPGFS